ncbi:hypothetical protein RQP46_008021 [Phenoliferia psychrophenolica]
MHIPQSVRSLAVSALSLGSVPAAPGSAAAPPTVASASSASGAADSFGNIPNPAGYTVPKYVTPSSAAWPNASDFAAIGAVPVRPWASVCYFSDPSYDADLCAVVQANYKVGYKRANQTGTAQELNWEECNSNSCLLNTFAPEQPQLGTCNQGRLPPYSVEVLTSDDAERAIKFALARNVRLVIKNTGHEYIGRSTAPDSLQLWTHHMNAISEVPTFMPEGNCSASVQPEAHAIRAGSGAMGGPLYEFANSIGRVLTLGAVGSVGGAGGLAQAGGHGPWGGVYGLAVDNVLEYTVVVNDAQGVRTVKANACQNVDLFSALRGGGGGVWGLVTELVFKSYPDNGYAVARIDVQPTTQALLTKGADAVLTDYMVNLASESAAWKQQGWAGYFFITGNNASFSYGVPNNSRAVFADMDRFFDSLTSNPDLEVTLNDMQTYPDGLTFFNEAMVPAGAVGYAESLGGRFIGESKFQDQAGFEAVAAAIIAAKNIVSPAVGVEAVTEQLQPIALQIYSTAGPPSAVPDCANGGSCLCPSWRKMIWHVVAAQGWTQGFPQELKNQYANDANNAMDPLRALTPHTSIESGSYYSETSALEPRWQQSFFGTNYPTLLKIKMKWDPANIFNVWKGVGWTGDVDPSYSCYANQ